MGKKGRSARGAGGIAGGGMNSNLLTVHMEPLRESDREQTVLGSKDTDVLVNMSTAHRDLRLSIGGNIASKRKQ